MDVLLVNPQNSRGRSYTVIPNIGLAYIAEAAREAHGMTILDCVRDRIGPGEFDAYLRKRPFEAVGFNMFTSAFSSVRRQIDVVRAALGRIPIVVGGAHPTFEPVETMESIPDIDYAFRGEGEEGFPRLLDRLDADGLPAEDVLSGIPNLVWRENGRIVLNTKSYVDDLDRFGAPAWDLVRPGDYPLAPNGIFSKKSRLAPVVLSRGCPYQCRFCGAEKSMGRNVRTRSVENILAEFRLLADDHGIEELHFMDDNFTHDRDFAMELCREMIASGPPLYWSCTNGVRIDTIDEELISLMERAGCYSMALGIESGSQKILDHMRKGITLDRIEETVGMIKDRTKIRLTGFFILGYPEETIEDIRKTIDMSVRLDIDRANFFNYSPFPGSPIYREIKSRGELPHLDYDDLYIHSIAYSPGAIPPETMKRLPRRAHLRFYMRPKILLRLAGEIRSFSQVKTIARRAAAILFQR